MEQRDGIFCSVLCEELVGLLIEFKRVLWRSGCKQRNRKDMFYRSGGFTSEKSFLNMIIGLNCSHCCRRTEPVAEVLNMTLRNCPCTAAIDEPPMHVTSTMLYSPDFAAVLGIRRLL